jgi:hypothetical protein
MKDVVMLGQFADPAFPGPEEGVGTGIGMSPSAIAETLDFLRVHEAVDRIIVSHPHGSASAAEVLNERPAVEPYSVAGQADFVLVMQYALARRGSCNDLLVIDQYFDGNTCALNDACSREGGLAYFDGNRVIKDHRTSIDMIYIDVDASQAVRNICKTGKLKSMPRGILYQTAGLYNVARPDVPTIFDAFQRADNYNLPCPSAHDTLNRIINTAAYSNSPYCALDVQMDLRQNANLSVITGSEKLKAIFNV